MTLTTDLAHLLYFGIAYRRIPFAEVMEWTDRAFSESPDHCLVDLVLCTSPHKFLECLNEHFDIQLWRPRYESMILSHHAKWLHNHPQDWLQVEESLLHYWSDVMAYQYSGEDKAFLYSVSLEADSRAWAGIRFEESEQFLREGLAPYLEAEGPNDLLMAAGLPPLRMGSSD